MLVRHLLPHLVPIIIVYATLGIAAAILFEATLSFLGVGVPPPAPSWGGMIIEHVGYYRTDPRVVALPGPRDHGHDPRVQSARGRPG